MPPAHAHSIGLGGDAGGRAGGVAQRVYRTARGVTSDSHEVTPVGVDALERSPIKGEIFGAGLLGSPARGFACRHPLAPIARPGWFHRRDRGPLIAQLDATERALNAARDTLAA